MTHPTFLSNEPGSSLVTVQQFCERHPWPSEPALRAYIFRAEALGLSQAIVRVGRRILLDEQLFFSLLRNLNQVSAQKPKGRGRPLYLVR
jgi:hypothetical protein